MLSKEEEIGPAQLRLTTLNNEPSAAGDNELDDFIRRQLSLPGEPLWRGSPGVNTRRDGPVTIIKAAAALLGISRHTLRTQLCGIIVPPPSGALSARRSTTSLATGNCASASSASAILS
ncbi:MAG: hypothetical protein ACLR17_12420 [Enterobacteriaceae bacterium]